MYHLCVYYVYVTMLKRLGGNREHYPLQFSLIRTEKKVDLGPGIRAGVG